MVAEQVGAELGLSGGHHGLPSTYGRVGDGEADGLAVGEGATEGTGLAEGGGAVSCVVAWSAMSVASSLIRETTA